MQVNRYNPSKHFENLIDNDYYTNLIKLRETIAKSCDSYFEKLLAPKIDLYMISKGISSPMGRGSDSLPVPLEFGNQHVYLVDSAQFGMEPIVINANFDIVYCYLPSFRGEKPDKRHLNQFYHCEAELKGDYKKCISIAEGLVKYILHNVVVSAKKKRFLFNKNNFSSAKVVSESSFPVISFDEVDTLFRKYRIKGGIERKSFGRVITPLGETMLCKLLTKNKLPVWIIKYDRDVVPFYQKPDPENQERVLNADLIFPGEMGIFGGEILGAGQRQNNIDELKESMKRQMIHSPKLYTWYIKLRNHPKYQTTSGFGLGIERLIAWVLAQDNIIDSAIYPVLKNQKIKY